MIQLAVGLSLDLLRPSSTTSTHISSQNTNEHTSFHSLNFTCKMMLYSSLLLSLLAVTSASDRWEGDPEMSDVDGSSDTFDPNAPHPAIPGCSIENGFFGDTSGSAAFVDFVYEVETAFGAIATMDRIIGDIEIAIVEKALPTLFSAECGGGRMLRRRLAAIGVSTLPTDEEIEGCKSKYIKSYSFQ
jgi:hypothetical protein